MHLRRIEWSEWVVFSTVRRRTWPAIGGPLSALLRHEKEGLFQSFALMQDRRDHRTSAEKQFQFESGSHIRVDDELASTTSSSCLGMAGRQCPARTFKKHMLVFRMTNSVESRHKSVGEVWTLHRA